MTTYTQNEQPIYRPPVEARTSALAIASLICGILGFALPCLVAAIVLGVIARKEIARSNGAIGGDGYAKAGIIISFGWVGIIIIGIIASIVIPATLRASSASSAVTAPAEDDSLSVDAMQGSVSEAKVKNTLATLYAALAIYRMDGTDAMPSTLQELVDSGRIQASAFSCGATEGFDPSNVDATGAFHYNPSARDSQVLLWEKTASHDSGSGPYALALMGDGSIANVTP